MFFGAEMVQMAPVLMSQNEKEVTSARFDVEINFVLGSDVAVCTLCNLATLFTETRVRSNNSL